MSMVDCTCDHCGKLFTARKADRNRGWARFCGKSCKALDQAKRKRGEGGADRMHDAAMMGATTGWDEGGWL